MRFRPYRKLAAAPASRAARSPMPDADIVILMLVLSPAFLAVVVWNVLRGNVIGPEATVCGTLVVLAARMALSAWRTRRPEPARPGQPPQG